MRKPRFPIAEIFGPTIQGEGLGIGLPSYFVRFAGCDYRCRWCDTKFAWKASCFLTTDEIMKQIDNLPDGPELITVTGGNPCLYELSEFIGQLKEQQWKLIVETQGSVFQDWVRNADHVVLSPKPPSAGMPLNFEILPGFLSCRSVELKVVVFDREDLSYAKELFSRYPQLSATISVGHKVGEDRESTLYRLALFVEEITRQKAFSKIRLLPQLQILIWGDQRGR